MNTSESPGDPKVTGLFSYPVKGARAIAHETAEVLTTGLRGDREWMLVDVRHSPAAFITQRERPVMATFGVHVAGDNLELTAMDGSACTVTAPPRSALIKVRVWNHETIALDAGDAAADWAAAQCGMANGSVRLVRFNSEMRRACNALYAGDSGAHTYFADGYPILIANENSLADLNARLARKGAEPLPMNRFRPNIVVSGLPAWDEDHVDTLSIGAVSLKLVKPCVRCQVTTTDQFSGDIVSDEPLATLSRFRNNPDLGGVTFGWNAVVLNGGSVRLDESFAAEYRF